LLHSGIADAHLPSNAGEATWLIFLSLYSVLGITGKLPDALRRLKPPGMGDE